MEEDAASSWKCSTSSHGERKFIESLTQSNLQFPENISTSILRENLITRKIIKQEDSFDRESLVNLFRKYLLPRPQRNHDMHFLDTAVKKVSLKHYENPSEPKRLKKCKMDSDNESMVSAESNQNIDESNGGSDLTVKMPGSKHDIKNSRPIKLKRKSFGVDNKVTQKSARLDEKEPVMSNLLNEIFSSTTSATSTQESSNPLEEKQAFKRVSPLRKIIDQKDQTQKGVRNFHESKRKVRLPEQKSEENFNNADAREISSEERWEYKLAEKQKQPKDVVELEMISLDVESEDGKKSVNVSAETIHVSIDGGSRFSTVLSKSSDQLRDRKYSGFRDDNYPQDSSNDRDRRKESDDRKYHKRTDGDGKDEKSKLGDKGSDSKRRRTPENYRKDSERSRRRSSSPDKTFRSRPYRNDYNRRRSPVRHSPVRHHDFRSRGRFAHRYDGRGRRGFLRGQHYYQRGGMVRPLRRHSRDFAHERVQERSRRERSSSNDDSHLRSKDGFHSRSKDDVQSKKIDDKVKKEKLSKKEKEKMKEEIKELERRIEIKSKRKAKDGDVEPSSEKTQLTPSQSTEGVESAIINVAIHSCEHIPLEENVVGSVSNLPNHTDGKEVVESTIDVAQTQEIIMKDVDLNSPSIHVTGGDHLSADDVELDEIMRSESNAVDTDQIKETDSKKDMMQPSDESNTKDEQQSDETKFKRKKKTKKKKVKKNKKSGSIDNGDHTKTVHVETSQGEVEEKETREPDGEEKIIAKKCLSDNNSKESSSESDENSSTSDASAYSGSSRRTKKKRKSKKQKGNSSDSDSSESSSDEDLSDSDEKSSKKKKKKKQRQKRLKKKRKYSKKKRRGQIVIKQRQLSEWLEKEKEKMREQILKDLLSQQITPKSENCTLNISSSSTKKKKEHMRERKTSKDDDKSIKEIKSNCVSGDECLDAEIAESSDNEKIFTDEHGFATGVTLRKEDVAIKDSGDNTPLLNQDEEVFELLKSDQEDLDYDLENEDEEEENWKRQSKNGSLDPTNTQDVHRGEVRDTHHRGIRNRRNRQDRNDKHRDHQHHSSHTYEKRDRPVAEKEKKRETYVQALNKDDKDHEKSRSKNHKDSSQSTANKDRSRSETKEMADGRMKIEKPGKDSASIDKANDKRYIGGDDPGKPFTRADATPMAPGTQQLTADGIAIAEKIRNDVYKLDDFWKGDNRNKSVGNDNVFGPEFSKHVPAPVLADRSTGHWHAPFTDPTTNDSRRLSDGTAKVGKEIVSKEQNKLNAQQSDAEKYQKTASRSSYLSENKGSFTPTQDKKDERRDCCEKPLHEERATDNMRKRQISDRKYTGYHGRRDDKHDNFKHTESRRKSDDRRDKRDDKKVDRKENRLDKERRVYNKDLERNNERFDSRKSNFKQVSPGNSNRTPDESTRLSGEMRQMINKNKTDKTKNFRDVLKGRRNSTGVASPFRNSKDPRESDYTKPERHYRDPKRR